MKKSKLPKTDSIDELAKFWDSHDLTDFDSELEEVKEQVFTPRDAIRVNLEAREAAAIRKLAKAKGISKEELVRGWVLQRLARTNGRNSKKRQHAGKTRRW